MTTKEKIFKIAIEKGLVRTRDFVVKLNISRQHASNILNQLVKEKKIIKIGSTRYAAYATPDYLKKKTEILPTRFYKELENKKLEEHKVLNDIERYFIPYDELSENIKNIFVYAFSEMLNNAIDHSKSKNIQVTINLMDNELIFEVNDFGIGIFRNVMKKRGLKNEMEAMQDLLKGKTTTAPKLHTGEGIFFTSKVADKFVLDSFGYKMIVDNKIKDVFLKKVPGQKQGTKVVFRINTNVKRHLNDVFRKYTNVKGGGVYGFDKTDIRVKLYALGGVHISRSQARRILSGLEKFDIIVMDYKNVPTVGQAFADEVYRVFKNKYSKIDIKNENMNEAVRFIVERAIHEAEK